MRDMPCFGGIDVAKAQLDIALRPSGERWSVPNDTNGVMTLVDRMQTLQPTLIVLEATGGLERLVTSAARDGVQPGSTRYCVRRRPSRASWSMRGVGAPRNSPPP